LYGDVEDDEAVLWVVSEWRGEPWSGGAMVGGGGTVEFFPFVLFTERRVRWEKEEEDGGARVGEGLGFAGGSMGI
jgi:hypothetical protein